MIQAVDYTTLAATIAQVRREWLPARLERVYQSDRHTLSLALRTLDRRGWLTLAWHPVAARLHLGPPPPRDLDTFTFSQQVWHQLKGLALLEIGPLAAWERVADLQFGRRPGEAPQAHLYVEIMGKYSNVILTEATGQIVSAAHQVSDRQSRLRPIQTGRPYEPPPAMTGAIPSLAEGRDRWQERVALVPGPVARQLRAAYRGVSAPLGRDLLRAARLPEGCTTDQLTEPEWERLWGGWQGWLRAIEGDRFAPARWRSCSAGLAPGVLGQVVGYTVLADLVEWSGRGEGESGRQDAYPTRDQTEDQVVGENGRQDAYPTGKFTVSGREELQREADLQGLLADYYGKYLSQETFSRLHHQLQQKLTGHLAKLSKKCQEFQQRWNQADGAETARSQADLLMACLDQWQPGLSEILLMEFVSGEPVKIVLDPTLNAVQNAQKLYKKYQKLSRSRAAIAPLLAEVEAEIAYLERVETALLTSEVYQSAEDLAALEEIRDELIDQGYLTDPGYRARTKGQAPEPDGFHRYPAPSGGEIWVGRNNAQNDRLTFRLAGRYDLWFHAQEIPGSHVLLRLPPGAGAAPEDLQVAADWAAFHSRARHSDRVPVVYTTPDRVYKPKGAKPGLAVYKNERILWGRPGQACPPAADRAIVPNAPQGSPSPQNPT